MAPRSRRINPARMTLPKKSGRVSRPAKIFTGNAGSFAAETSWESLRRASGNSVTVSASQYGQLRVAERLDLDSIVSAQQLAQASELVKFRLAMIFETYQRSWNDVEAHQQALRERLRHTLRGILPESVVALKFRSLELSFLKLKGTMNTRFTNEIQNELQMWGTKAKPDVTDNSQRVLRICAWLLPMSCLLLTVLFPRVYHTYA